MRCSTAVLWLAIASSAWRAEATTSVCDIEVQPGLKYYFYVVTLNGEPYKGKRYIDYRDALALRDVLIESDLCWRPKTVRKCAVQALDGGRYTVTRAGTVFDPTAVFAKPAAARKRAKRLAAVHLCYVE